MNNADPKNRPRDQWWTFNEQRVRVVTGNLADDVAAELRRLREIEARQECRDQWPEQGAEFRDSFVKKEGK